jgi:hypothetical protein
MTCEDESKEFTEAAKAYVRVDDELRELQLSWAGTPGSPPKQVVGGGGEWKRAERLTQQRDQEYERYRAAGVAYMEAVIHHRD